MKVDYSFSPYKKINSKWINLNIRLDTICYREENIDTNLMDLSLRKDFVKLTQMQEKEVKQTQKNGTRANKKFLHRKIKHWPNKKANSQMGEDNCE